MPRLAPRLEVVSAAEKVGPNKKGHGPRPGWPLAHAVEFPGGALNDIQAKSLIDLGAIDHIEYKES